MIPADQLKELYVRYLVGLQRLAERERREVATLFERSKKK